MTTQMKSAESANEITERIDDLLSDRARAAIRLHRDALGCHYWPGRDLALVSVSLPLSDGVVEISGGPYEVLTFPLLIPIAAGGVRAAVAGVQELARRLDPTAQPTDVGLPECLDRQVTRMLDQYACAESGDDETGDAESEPREPLAVASA